MGETEPSKASKDESGLDWVKVAVGMIAGLLATIFASSVVLFARTVINSIQGLQKEIHAVDRRVSQMESLQERRTLQQKASEAAKREVERKIHYFNPRGDERRGSSTDLPE